MAVVIQHATHLFATTGICGKCNAFRDSYAASRGCRGEAPKTAQPWRAVGRRTAAAERCCTVCDKEPAVTTVQIREGGSQERVCIGCLRWLRDSLTGALVDALAATGVADGG